MSQNKRMVQWREKVSTLSEREKWLLVVTGFVLILGALDVLFIQPMRDQRAAFELQIQGIRSQQANYAQQQEALIQQISNDPAMVMARKMEGLNKAIGINEERLRSYTQSLVSPEEMTDLLKQLLDEFQGLKLIALENRAVTALLQEDQQQGEEANTRDFGLYRHPVRLIFEGNYGDTLSYLKILESMKSKFYWQRFDYQVIEHPRAQVSINIYTLSTQQWWIGQYEKRS